MAIPKLPSYQITDDILPTENRVSWSLNSGSAVLLIHDMQQYFLNFYDQKASPVPQVIKQIQRLKKICKAQGIPVVYTAQPGNQSEDHRALLSDFWGPGLGDDPGLTKVVDALAPDADDIVLTKWRYSAFQRSDLLQRMQHWQRNQLIVAGVYTHIGCQQTVVDAFMNDQQAFLIADATADFSLAEHKYALQYVATRAGRVITSEQAFKQLTVAEGECINV
jgi:bifunctional isochorismate lyase/aryl carrier protein